MHEFEVIDCNCGNGGLVKVVSRNSIPSSSSLPCFTGKCRNAFAQGGECFGMMEFALVPRVLIDKCLLVNGETNTGVDTTVPAPALNYSETGDGLGLTTSG